MEQIKISVRNLVEFILRSGDIDNRGGRAVQREAMQEGSRIHRKIQRRMGASYQAEVSLKIALEQAQYTLVIEGRADGLITEDAGVVIDEIKGVYQDIHLMEGPVDVHLAQAKCYACIYGMQQELKSIGVQMTYCNIDTEEIRRFQQEYTMEELTKWFLELVDAYRKWADFQYEARVLMQESIHGLEFPYPYRDGQRELAVGVYRTILRAKNLFIQAPTGTGKTIATVFPAIKAVGEGLGEKLFYLTAKTITRTVAAEAFALLKERGYCGSVLTITAKDKLCRCEETECNPVACPYAEGHYDRVNEAVFQLLQRTKEMTREIFLEQAKQYRVCPFELCLDTSLWVDVIICDYNYVFDPNVFLKRFFSEGIKGEYIFLIDEAHNLVERGREMYSAVLYKEDFLSVKKLVRDYSRKVAGNLDKCNKKLLELKRECENYNELENISHFSFALMNLGAAMDEFLQQNVEFPEKKAFLDFYLKVRHFLNMHERLDENYVIYDQHEPDGKFSIKLYCVNPAVNLQECLNKGRSTVFFSATLLPIQYYKSLLSTREDNYAVYAQSIFSEKKRLLAVARDVSSKYTRRNEREFERIASYIYRTAQAKQGNYLVFFPSYKLLDQVLQHFLAMAQEVMDCLIQEPSMGEERREEFLQEFSRQRDKTLVGFCVMGGIFSEGIDLKGERLIGALIVGTGLPQISNEREILKQYYDKVNGEGFAYAFRYPGMNKVLQSAGRVIRTVGDQGVIVLLDERFLQQEYQELFPREWSHYHVVAIENVAQALEDFWTSQGLGGEESE